MCCGKKPKKRRNYGPKSGLRKSTVKSSFEVNQETKKDAEHNPNQQ